jgi:cation diffusion facilitator family transporter
MSAEEHSTKHIIQSLGVNLVIAVIKTGAAVLTKSGSMLAEAIHSFADCGNQLLLLVGVRTARKPADASHPLGYGRSLYFWSFVVALMIFAGGGVFSVYEGLHKIHAPEPVERVGLGLVILGVSLLLEGSAALSNMRDLKKGAPGKPFLRILHDTKDSDLVVVFGENAAAVLGLVVAMLALVMAWWTGDGRWDGGGSVVIGLVLIGVAAFLAIEVVSLLVGESADPAIAVDARAIALRQPKVDRVLNLITVQQGPHEVLVAIKLSFSRDLDVDGLCDAINAYEKDLRAAHSDVVWLFVEPDTPHADGSPS